MMWEADGTYEQDLYGNGTLFWSTDIYQYSINMKSNSCSAVKLDTTGIELNDMVIKAGEFLPLTQMIADLPVNVTCSGLDEGELCCGERIYTLTDADDYDNFFTVSSDTGENVLTLLSQSYDDVGTYALSVTVSLRDWPNCAPVTLPIAVEVEDCVPALVRSGVLSDLVWEPEQLYGPGVAEDWVASDLVISAPTWDMDPVCALAVTYTAIGLEDWMQYDSAANELIMGNAASRNGTYTITV